tara:strand:+ start:2102 stop:3004 length:903 start_codon:yes stop_codon:yes gene_type:complete
MRQVFLLFCLLTGLWSCDKNEVISPQTAQGLEGTGLYHFKAYPNLAAGGLPVFYHVPADLPANAPVLIVFHGNGRDAEYSRDQLIAKANRLKFALVVPEFSSDAYPGGDKYNLGNIFEDGDHPSESTLNPKEEWTFSVIEPLFENFKTRTGLSTTQFDVFGHSAGAQVAHRYLFFWNDAPMNRVVAAAAGWYTLPDTSVQFPYGLGASPAENADLSTFFSRPLTIVIGTADNDPNAASLRQTPQARAQGTNRLARAQYFYQQSIQQAQAIASPFSWQYRELQNVDHDFEATSAFAADLLY